MEDKKWLAEALVEFLEKKIEDEADLSLDCVEKNFGYSKFYLNRVFAEKMGCTIHRYIVEQRLKRAARLLSDTEEPITDIACGAGYQSQQAFTQAFKQKFGCSPLIYREKGSMRITKQKRETVRSNFTSNTWRCAA